MPKLPSVEETKKEKKKEEIDFEKYIYINGELKLRIPKTEYEEGNDGKSLPKPAIPDLDIDNYEEEMDKYL